MKNTGLSVTTTIVRPPSFVLVSLAQRIGNCRSPTLHTPDFRGLAQRVQEIGVAAMLERVLDRRAVRIRRVAVDVDLQRRRGRASRPLDLRIDVEHFRRPDTAGLARR